MDRGTPDSSAPFILTVRAMHIKYGEGEGKNLGRKMAEYMLHSTLIAKMDEENV